MLNKAYASLGRRTRCSLSLSKPVIKQVKTLLDIEIYDFDGESAVRDHGYDDSVGITLDGRKSHFAKLENNPEACKSLCRSESTKELQGLDEIKRHLGKNGLE